LCRSLSGAPDSSKTIGGCGSIGAMRNGASGSVHRRMRDAFAAVRTLPGGIDMVRCSTRSRGAGRDDDQGALAGPHRGGARAVARRIALRARSGGHAVGGLGGNDRRRGDRHLRGRRVLLPRDRRGMGQPRHRAAAARVAVAARLRAGAHRDDQRGRVRPGHRRAVVLGDERAATRARRTCPAEPVLKRVAPTHAPGPPRGEHLLAARIGGWFDRNVLALARDVRLSYLPPLMVYLAAGISGLTAIVGTFFVKEYLGLSAEFLAALGFWAGLPWALKMPLGHLVDLIWRYKAGLVWLGASLIAVSLLVMIGLLADPQRMTAILPAESWYVLAALLAPIGYVTQDVVA